MVQVSGAELRDLRPMSEGELKGILNAKVTNSLGYYGGKLSRARVQALQYYNGEPFGNEQDGRSQVISRDVAEAIDSVMPALMRIFASGEEIVRFDATKPDKVEAARQATDYVNWIFMQQNKGFQNLYAWFKDALLNRTAGLKIWWDTQIDVAKETYEGLTDAEFAILIGDDEDEDLEIISHESYPDPLAAAVPSTAAPAGAGGATVPSASPPPQMPQPQAAPAPPSPAAPMIGHNGGPELPPPIPILHDVVLRRTNKTGRVHILPIPGEEFLMDRRAVSLEDTPFVAHRCKKTISDLVEMGYDYDVVKTLGEGDSSDFNLERLERFRQEDELPYRTGNNYDPSMKEVWVNECYLKVDYDGDGIAELRKITFAGESGNFAPGATVILSNEEVDDHPFAALCPIPMPHKFYGMSLADQTMDLQLIKSTLFRTVLDHSYNAIMPQVMVDTTRVNLDDLLTRRPGGVIRTKGPPGDCAEPLTNGQLGVDPFQLISYLDQVREQRTGVRRFTAGPGADVLNTAYTQTATGANMVENSSQERIELIARCFAELGLVPAFRKILKLITQNQNEPKIIRLRGKFVPMDPREWDTEFDLTSTVGLGTGNRQQQIQTMGFLLNLDQEIIKAQQGVNGPLVTAQNVYAKLDKLCNYAGLKSAETYYTDPAQTPAQPQQPRPDPHVIAAQVGAQAEMQKEQLRARLDAQKTQLQMQADHVKTQAQIAADIQIAMAKIAAEREVQYARIASDRDEFNAQALLDLNRQATDRAMKGHGGGKRPPAPRAVKTRKRVTVNRDPATGNIMGADIDEIPEMSSPQMPGPATPTTPTPVTP